MQQYGSPTIALYLDRRHKLKNGKYMLKLRVGFNVHSKQVQKYYSTGYSLSEKEWDGYNATPVPFALRKMRQEIIKFEAKANSIIEEDPRISVEMFEARLIGKYAAGSGISILFKEVISQFEHEGRISTASAYRCALKSLMEYRGDFPLEVVDYEFLDGYEKWMTTAQDKDNRAESITTVGFYLRALRAIYNIAMEKRIVSRDLYPFGRNGYTIPKGSNFKKALKAVDKVKVQKVKGADDYEKRAIAFWMFSYYCNGMNFTDMAYLRPSDIHEEVITFVRRKTMRTVREVKPIVVPIRNEVHKIIAQYGKHEPYCFGIINDEHTPKEKYNKIRDWIKRTNKYVNRVTKRLGILGKVNTYNARHTFATMLLKGKTDVKAIQQSLGHRSISTTEAYLADLDIEEAKKISKLL